MGKFTGVLLVSDFDDTLCDDNVYIPPVNLQAIDEFIRQGGVFTVATGRAHRTFAPHAHDVTMNAPVILSNGALLYDFEKNRPVIECPLPREAAGDLAALCEALPQLGVECYHGDDVYIHHPNEHTRRHVIRVNTTWTQADLAEMPQPWNKAVIQADHASLLEAQKWLLERFGERYEVIFSNDVLLECTAKGVSKGSTVLRLAKMLNIDPAHVYCAGNNENDIPLLEVSRIPFAPSDCAPVVKAWGATLVAPCGVGAIAEIIEKLGRIY